MKQNSKVDGVNWHIWDKPYDEYLPEEAHNYEPNPELWYRHDPGNESYYSILEPTEVEQILLQIRAGAKLETYRLRHFSDDDADCLAEILERDAIETFETFDDEFLVVAAFHLAMLESTRIAELMIIYALGKGETVNDIVYQSSVGDSVYGDEGLDNEFLPFVKMCDKKRLKEKLHLELETSGVAKRKIKI